jgi:hypothetical protein
VPARAVEGQEQARAVAPRADGGPGIRLRRARPAARGEPRRELRPRLEHRVGQRLGDEALVDVEGAPVAEDLHQRRRRERAALRGRPHRLEVSLALDQQVEVRRELRARARRPLEREADRRAGEAPERGGGGRGIAERRIGREVDDQERRAAERRMLLGRERRAQPLDRLREGQCSGAYRAPSASSARTTRRRSFPVSL